jgi:hypothetical protein
MRTDKLNPDLMIGDEVTVIDVDSSFGTMNTAERFKDYVVTAIKQSNQTQETYYDVKPINETDEELLGRMLAGGGMIRREHLYPTDTWMLRKGFLRGELNEHNQPGINPELMVGDEILVVSTEGIHDFGAPELYKPYVVVGIKHGTTMMKGGKELEDYPYYQVEPIGMTDEERTGAMLAGGGRMKPMYIFPRQDQWILRKGFLRGELEEEPNEIARTLSKARKHGVGTRFPKAAIEANPQRFRKYTRDKYLKEQQEISPVPQPGLNPQLKVDDIVRVIDVDGEHGRMPKRFETYIVVKVGKTYPLMTKRNRGHDNEYYDIRPYPDSSTQFSELDVKTLYRGDTWIYAKVPMANKVDRKTIGEQVNPEDYGIIDGEKRDAEAAKSNTPDAPDRTPFTKLEVAILKQLHKNLDRSGLQTVVDETPGDYGSGKKFWDVMKLFGINYMRDVVEDTRTTKYAKWALDNWTEDGDYGSIERPIKEKLKWFDVDREESGTQVEYKDGSAEVLGFDGDDAGTRADYDFYAWGGEMETNDYGDYEQYDSEITRSDFIRVDEGLTPKMVEELKGPKEIQDLLFNFWKNHGPTLDPDRLKLIGFNMNDADDRTKVIFNLVEYYGDEELINIITDRLEGIQGWEYEYVVTSIDFHDLLNFNSYPFTIMVDVIVDGSTEVPVTTEDGIEDITLWEANERAQKEWKGGGPGPYDNMYEEVREQVLSDVSILLKNLPVEPMLDYVDFSEPNESIDNYVGTPEIMTESKIDKLVWKEKPPKKHEKRMEKDFGVFKGFPIKDFMSTNPPKNGSEEVMDELMLLDSLPLIDEFVDTTDDIFPHFEKYFKEKDLEFPEEELKDITKDTSPIILKLKYHYNRPRPQQLANAKGLKFHQEPLDSAKTPAYPSGHATQGRLIAKILADKYPKHKSEINKLGNEIGTGRLVAKVHYPSDDLFGKELGDSLYKFIKDKEIIKEENDIIIKDDNHPYDYKDYDKFINYVVYELNIENPPTIYVEKEPSSEYTGGTYRYKGGAERIKVRSKDRSLMDILRSLAHELVHHKQKEDGMFEDKEVIKDIPEVGGPIEDEANAIAGRLIKKYGKQNHDLYEQVMVDTGDMLKSDVFKFLSNRFILTPTEYSEIKDDSGNYYRIIDMNTPDEPVNLSDLIEPVIEFVGYGLKSGTFKEEDTQKGIEAITSWLSLAMNQYKEPIN